MLTLTIACYHPSLKFIKLLTSLKHLESAEDEDSRTTNAFNPEFLKQVTEARFQQRTLQQASGNQERG
ncbi:hypothetical protein A0J61_11124 [Choanephora cucurbitarum]|uniref:Uncharacterized protein n=1 Tax=Choanephora cucurbitarum TaxID=101091 RepID=A0A1C7MVN2_9FUNG|nr:hypothetical protein A0J61_11124 [Choanephora cucurbitarum]